MAHPWFDPDALVGVDVGGYRLSKLAGTGGFGAVYLTEPLDGIPRAMKIAYPPDSTKPQDLDVWTPRATHFLREATTAGRFHHPNIARVYDTGEFLWHHDDPHGDHTGDYLLPYYVTDYMPDGLDRRPLGSFKANAVSQIARSICDGLLELHSAEPKVYHLDLNPGNIRLTERDLPVISDFGVAHLDGPGLPDVTGPPSIHPGVAAPEQLRGEAPDERTDIYQLGSLLCWMLTGHYPNQGGIPVLISQQDIGQHLKDTIIRCTDASRDRRYQNVVELKEAFAVDRSKVEWLISLIPPWIRRFRRGGARVVGFVLLLIAVLWVIGPLPLPKTVEITIASSSTKQEWMNEMVADFNRRSKEDRSLQVRRNPLQWFGDSIKVTIIKEEIEPGVFNEGWRSGAMVDALLGGSLRPTIVSPADHTWVEKFVQSWPDSFARITQGGPPNIMTGQAEDLLRTPLVLAMWESRAEALDCWPEAGPGCTWEAIISLGSHPAGWASLGYPSDWGALKFGHAIVGRSNSATFTAMLVCLAGLNDLDTVTVDDVNVDNGCGNAILQLGQAEIFTDVSNSRLLREMREGGPGHLDAVATYESEIVEINQVRGLILPEALVSVYPQDGTTAATHPFAVPDGAPWVSKAQAEAASIFLQFLLRPEQQALLVRRGLRPIDQDAPLGVPIDLGHGANPATTLRYPEITLEMLKQVEAVWFNVTSTLR